MNDRTVEQLHRSLVAALRRTRPNALHRPVTVAEIYQDLVPYRTARDEIGFEMNADYEHALLRLLAGEGDFARIEPREVRDKLRMELESANPDVGLFRNYAACDVWVSMMDEPQKDDEAAESTDVADSWEEEFVGPTDDTGGAEHVTDAVLQEAARAAAVPFEIASEEEEQEAVSETAVPELEIIEEEESTTCAFCGGDLPAGRMVNFCPYCGTDQSQQPCPSCGEMLDPLWRFCISCGARVRPLGDHVN